MPKYLNDCEHSYNTCTIKIGENHSYIECFSNTGSHGYENHAIEDEWDYGITDSRCHISNI